jgi:hypothetical protein
MNIIKPSANQITLTTANTIYGAPVVFVSANASALITITSNASVVTGTFVIPANQYIFVQKLPTDTLTANVAVSATAASYRG